MKLIIDIPDDIYDDIQHNRGEYINTLNWAVRNGTRYNPSGDLISRNALEKEIFGPGSYDACEDLWGFCDPSIHCIFIDKTIDLNDKRNIANLDRHFNKVLRHEIVHAFLDESGLMENAKFDDEHFEQMVDWIAIQFPKLMCVYQELDILS